MGRSLSTNYPEDWRRKIKLNGELDDIAYAMNTRISSRTNTMPFVLMLGRVPFGIQKYRMEKKIPGLVEEMPEEIKDKEEWKRRLQLMNELVYPTIGKEVQRKQGILADQMNEKRKLISFDVGKFVMAKDVTRESKWNAPYVGPFCIIRCNKGGANFLEDRAKRVLPFRFPPSHLKKAPHARALTEISYVVKKILDHKGAGELKEYLVESPMGGKKLYGQLGSKREFRWYQYDLGA
jgi:hypothetical protein